MKLLTEDEYFTLQAQFDVTPPPSECSSSGAHCLLIAALNRLGYHPNGRDDAYRMAEELLADGYKLSDDMQESEASQ